MSLYRIVFCALSSTVLMLSGCGVSVPQTDLQKDAINNKSSISDKVVTTNLPPEEIVSNQGTEINGSFLTGDFEPAPGASEDSVAGAHITILGKPDLSGTTDENGRFRIAVPPGTYNIYAVSKDKGYGVTLESSAVANRTTDVGSVRFKKTGAIAAEISLLSENISDLSGTDMYVPGTSFLAKSNAAGMVTLSGLPPGVYNLRIERDGVLPRDYSSITVEEDTTTYLPKENTVLQVSLGPVGTFLIASDKTLVLNNIEYDLVTNPTVLVSLVYGQFAALYKLATRGDFLGAQNKNVKATDHINLIEGANEIFIKYSDLNGQEGVVASRKVFVDTLAPTLQSFELYGGLGQTSSRTVFVDLAASDAGSGLKDFRMSEFADYRDASWQILEGASQRVSFSLSETSGLKTVYLQARDRAENVSESLSQTITLTYNASDKNWLSLQSQFPPANQMSSGFFDVFTQGDSAIMAFIEPSAPLTGGSAAVIGSLKVARYQSGEWQGAVALESNSKYANIAPLVRLNSSGDALLVTSRYLNSLPATKPAFSARTQTHSGSTWTSPVAVGVSPEIPVSIDAVADTNNIFHLLMEHQVESETSATQRLDYRSLQVPSSGTPSLSPPLRIDEDPSMTISTGKLLGARIIANSENDLFSFWSWEMAFGFLDESSDWVSRALYKPYMKANITRNHDPKEVDPDGFNWWTDPIGDSEESDELGGSEKIMDVHLASDNHVWTLYCQEDLIHQDHPGFVRRLGYEEMESLNPSDPTFAAQRLLLPVQVTTLNNKLDFMLDGTSFTADVPEKTYTDIIKLTEAVTAAMNDAIEGDPDYGALVFEVTLVLETSKVRISAIQGNHVFSLLWKTGVNSGSSIGPTLGFSPDADRTSESADEFGFGYYADSVKTSRVKCTDTTKNSSTARVVSDSSNNAIVVWVDDANAVHVRRQASTGVWLAAETIADFEEGVLLRNVNLIIHDSGKLTVSYDTKDGKKLRVWAHHYSGSSWRAASLVDDFSIVGYADADLENLTFDPKSRLVLLPGGIPSLFWLQYETSGLVPRIKSAVFQ